MIKVLYHKELVTGNTITALQAVPVLREIPKRNVFSKPHSAPWNVSSTQHPYGRRSVKVHVCLTRSALLFFCTQSSISREKHNDNSEVGTSLHLEPACLEQTPSWHQRTLCTQTTAAIPFAASFQPPAFHFPVLKWLLPATSAFLPLTNPQWRWGRGVSIPGCSERARESYYKEYYHHQIVDPGATAAPVLGGDNGVCNT
jgi:hypothetical protein